MKKRRQIWNSLFKNDGENCVLIAWRGETNTPSLDIKILSMNALKFT